MSLLKKILLGLLALLVILQFVPVDRSVPDTINPSEDLIEIENIQPEMVQLLQQACYDCHSYETKYPWYAYTAPAKWILQNHVVEGREHLNFSKWGSYESGKKAHKAEECIEEVEEGHMPLPGYSKMHKEAQLTDQQIAEIKQLFSEIMQKYNNK